MKPSRPFTLASSIALLALSAAACTSAGSEPTAEVEPSTQPSSKAVATAEPELLFQRSGTRRPHVAWVGLDGSGESAPLTDFGDGAQTNPDWSPDGTRIVFAMTDGTTDDLYVADAGASDATKLLDCVSPCLYLDDPAWSPDGERIVYSRTTDRDGAAVGALESVEVATGEVDLLLGPWVRQFTAGARWSPDGRRIVFEMVSKTGSELEADLSGVTLSVLRLDAAYSTMRTNTDPMRLADRGLTDPALFADTADWSPDGRWIVYSALATPGAEASDLFAVRARGGPPRQLTHLVGDGGYADEPTFTPDGASVVFSGARTSSEDELLLQVSLDGTGLGLATGDVEIHGRHPRVR